MDTNFLTSTAILESAFLLLVGLVLVLAVRAHRLRGAQRTDHDLMDQELTRTQRELAQKERELEFHTKFLRHFPHQAERLSSRLTMRELPDSLLQIMKQVFEPKLAMVVLRRKRTGADGDVEKPLHVVACSPENGSIKPGTEVPIGIGPIGLVAEAQRAMSQEDFNKELLVTGGRHGEFHGVTIDLAAPMIFDEETVGVLAMAGNARHPAGSKEALRLVAQIAALTYYNVAAFRHMKRNAELDRLTGALNKASVTQTLSEELMRAEKRGGKLSIFLFDIDNFKSYNDANGHLSGDKLLVSLADLVKDQTRSDDIFGRFGGEEFLLILPETAQSGALIAANKVSKAISLTPFPHAGAQPLGCVSVSGGVATFPDHARDSTSLLRIADQALYRAKSAGRNRIYSADVAPISALHGA